MVAKQIKSCDRIYDIAEQYVGKGTVLAESIRGAEFSYDIYPIFEDSTDIKEAVSTEEFFEVRSVNRNLETEDGQQPERVFCRSPHAKPKSSRLSLDFSRPGNKSCGYQSNKRKTKKADTCLKSERTIHEPDLVLSGGQLDCAKQIVS
jgi:hypothetical protein